MRYLIKVNVVYDGKNNWTLQADHGLGIKTFHGTPEQFTKLLRRLKASNSNDDPRSYRTISYSDMCDRLKNGLDRQVYIWSFMWPFGANKSVGVIPNGEVQEKIIKESDNMDQNTTVEYLNNMKTGKVLVYVSSATTFLYDFKIYSKNGMLSFNAGKNYISLFIKDVSHSFHKGDALNVILRNNDSITIR